MNFPVGSPTQLKAVLRALRKSQQLSQVELGHLIGVNQKRIARIEANPGITSFDQIARIASALGARVLIEPIEKSETAKPAVKASSTRPSASPKTRRALNW